MHDIRRDALSQLLLVTDLMQSDMRRGLEKLGLTQVRAHLIWELGDRQPMTQRDLAKVLRVTPRNVTALVDALENTGFLNRSAHPTDRRAILVSLSSAGETARERLHAEMGVLADTLFSNVTQGDLAAFTRVVNAASEKLALLATR